MNPQSDKDYPSFIALIIPAMLDGAFLPKELGQVLEHDVRTEQLSDACAKIWTFLEQVTKPAEQNKLSIEDELEIPFRIARAIEGTLQARANELSPDDLGNLHDLRDSAIKHMGKWQVAERLRAATLGTELAQMALRNITHAALKLSNAKSLRALTLIIEAVSASPIMGNMGIEAHKEIAGRGAWAAVQQQIDAGGGRNYFVEKLLFENFGGPHQGYVPPGEKELAVAIPPVGLTIEEAWTMQETEQHRAQGGFAARPASPQPSRQLMLELVA